MNFYKIEEELIVTHLRLKESSIFTTNIKHYNKYKRLYPGNKENNKIYDKYIEIGRSCEMILSLIKQNNRDYHKSVKGILYLRYYYSKNSINKSYSRAIDYRIKILQHQIQS